METIRHNFLLHMCWLRFSLSSWFLKYSGSFHYTQNAKHLDEIWMSKKIWIFFTSSDFWKNVFTVPLHVSSHAIKALSSSTRNYDVTTKKEFGIETCKVHWKKKKGPRKLDLLYRKNSKVFFWGEGAQLCWIFMVAHSSFCCSFLFSLVVMGKILLS